MVDLLEYVVPCQERSVMRLLKVKKRGCLIGESEMCAIRGTSRKNVVKFEQKFNLEIVERGGLKASDSEIYRDRQKEIQTTKKGEGEKKEMRTRDRRREESGRKRGPPQLSDVLLIK